MSVTQGVAALRYNHRVPFSGVRGPVSIAVLGCALAIAALAATIRATNEAFIAGPDVDASELPATQAEVSIAVDRFRPGRVLAASMSLYSGGILAMSSSDAGASWTRTDLPPGAGSYIDADPMVAFDSRGRAFLAKIPVDSVNTSLGIEVTRSDDGGVTWGPVHRISENRGQDDKVILAADDEPGSPYRDRVYVAWKFPGGGVYFSRSLDSGATFSPPRQIESAVVSGLDMSTAADGTVYLAFHDNPRRSIRVMRSQDGGASFAPSLPAASVRAGWYVVPPAQCARPALVHASISVDRSNSPWRGRLYAAWADYDPGVSESTCPNDCGAPAICAPSVWCARSDDGGSTWTAPARVHETGPGRVDRFHQWIRVDPGDGAVYVAYKDTRNDPSARLGTDVYLSRSADGAASWEPSVRLSSVTSRSGHSFQYGDYQGVAAAGGNVYAAWADYRDVPNASDIYVRRLYYDPFPSAQRGRVERTSGPRPGVHP